jgi:hypothetical protein
LVNKKRYDELHLLADGKHPKVHPNGKTMDVGIDTHSEFRPYSFDEIYEIMSKRNIAYVDNHKGAEW